MYIKGKKKNEDGSVRILIKIPNSEVESLMRESEKIESIKPAFLGIDFGRKADDCITCAHNGQKHDIQVYGDIHAGLIGASICGSFQMRIGKCS